MLVNYEIETVSGAKMKKLSIITGLILGCVSFAAAFEWAVQSGSYYCWPTGMAVDPDGTVYVTGGFGGYFNAGGKQIKVKSAKPALMDFGDDPTKVLSGAVLYIGFEGPKPVVKAEENCALSVSEKAGGRQLPQEEAETFWRDRHVIARRFKENRLQRRAGRRDGVRWEWLHVALPTSRVLEFRKVAMEVLAERGIALQESGLWTQPELFSMRLAVEGREDERAQVRLEDALEDLLRLTQRMGGSMEYCHGVGIKLAPLMAEEHGYGLEVMRQIKKALDPNNIMNPGKMGL